MELVEGRTFWDPQLPGLERAHRRAIYESMVVTLARLHDTDVAAVGSAGFALKGNYFERQVSRWIRQYRASETERLPYMERLIEWLPGTIPTQAQTAIIHGDYRIENILFAMQAPAVEAVIDWELATIGDPLADLSYFAMHWLLPTHERGGLEGVDFSELGIPTLEEVIALYCAARGCVLPSNLSWYFAYNLFRLTSILQGIKKRSLVGNASSASAEASVAGIAYVAEIGWRTACLAEAK
jgi:aminoglycoside phosphotransferase (APT) family kinase protein